MTTGLAAFTALVAFAVTVPDSALAAAQQPTPEYDVAVGTSLVTGTAA
jgi:hypothetical protein